MLQHNHFVKYSDEIFNGYWDASLGPYPVVSDSEKNNIEQQGYWLVTTTGTVKGVLYNIGDWLYYDGRGNFSALKIGAQSLTHKHHETHEIGGDDEVNIDGGLF